MYSLPGRHVTARALAGALLGAARTALIVCAVIAAIVVFRAGGWEALDPYGTGSQWHVLAHSVYEWRLVVAAVFIGVACHEFWKRKTTR